MGRSTSATLETVIRDVSRRCGIDLADVDALEMDQEVHYSWTQGTGRDTFRTGHRMSTLRTVDVTACIDQRPISGCQWLVMLLCFLIVLVDGFDTAMAGYIAPALVDDLGVPRTALGPVLSAALLVGTA